MSKGIRIRQKITSLGIRAAGIKEPTLITGENSLLRVPDFIKDSGYKKAMLITTPGFIKRGSLQPLLDKFEDLGIEVVIYSDVMPDPTITCVEEVVRLYNEKQCRCIVAIGGGSVMDCAKVVGARIVRPEVQVRDMRGLLKINKTLPDLYAVPTTAGTGSETTVAAVITDEVDGTHYKYAVSDFCLVPKYAVMYPEITLSLPPHITAATGMDALTHAVETYTNLYASKKVQKYAKDAVKLIFENLEVVYKDGDNLEARNNMLMASYYAGVAFTNNFVGYVHAVAHAFGGLYGLAHGYANAILLPAVMEQYGEPAYKSLAELADVVGIEGANIKEKAENFIEAIYQMNRDMNIPDHVAELKEEDFDEIVKRAITEANPAYPVPVIWDEEDFKLLLRRLLVRE